MCFSATASFISGTSLLAIGATCAKLAPSKKEKVLSIIPIVFGIQQITEGFLWLGLQGQLLVPQVQWFTMLFLIFAWVLWPLVIPAIFMVYTIGYSRKLISNVFLALGLMVAVFNAYSLATVVPWAEISGRHILYHWTEFRVFADAVGFIYVAVTLLPPFLTNRKPLWLLGAVNAVMFMFSYLFMSQYLISVWCFMAAICSAMVLGIVWRWRSTNIGQKVLGK